MEAIRKINEDKRNESGGTQRKHKVKEEKKETK